MNRVDKGPLWRGPLWLALAEWACCGPLGPNGAQWLSHLPPLGPIGLHWAATRQFGKCNPQGSPPQGPPMNPVIESLKFLKALPR